MKRKSLWAATIVFAIGFAILGTTLYVYKGAWEVFLSSLAGGLIAIGLFEVPFRNVLNGPTKRHHKEPM